MSQGETPPPFPTIAGDIAWRGYYLKADFYPSIKMTRKGGLDFAALIHTWMEIGSTTAESNEWEIKGAGAHDGMKVVITKNNVQIVVADPANGLEWYEQRIAGLLDAFRKHFDIKMLLSSGAMATGLLKVNGDARAFMGGAIMLMHPNRFITFDRPLHLLGVKFILPPNDGEDWDVAVKIESCAGDEHKIYVEADANWNDSDEWNSATPSELVSKIGTITGFMTGKLLTFLRTSPLEGFNDEEDSDANDTPDGKGQHD